MSGTVKFESTHRTALRGIATNAGLADVTVQLATDKGRQEVSANLPLAGPAQMVGIRPNTITKRVPSPRSGDFRAGALPYIELDDVALPWAMAFDGKPLIGLLCVPDTSEVQLIESSVPNPTLFLTATDFVLPPVSAFQLMAHIQQTKTGRIARLLCPQYLQAGMRYIAALVPLTQVGVNAALGEKPDPDVVGHAEPAWQDGATSARLPVFDWWRFGTGTGRSAEDILRDLRVQDVNAAPRPIAVDDETAELLGLQPGETVERATLFVEESTKLPELGALTEALSQTTPSGERRLALPSYGKQHADAQDAGDGLKRDDPDWFRQLNRTPSYRVLASLGAEVVRRHQDACIGFVRQSAGQVEEANALLSRGELAVRTGNRAQAAMDSLSDEALLRVAGPALARTKLASGSAAAAMGRSAMGVATNPTLRRRVGKGGTPRAGQRPPPGRSMAEDIKLMSDTIRTDDHVAGTAGLRGDEAAGTGRAAVFFGDAEREDPKETLVKLIEEIPMTEPKNDRERASALIGAGQAAQNDEKRPVGPERRDKSPRSADILDTREALKPTVSVPPRLRARIGGSEAMAENPPPKRLRHDPVWPAPLIELLFDIDPNVIAPGLATVQIDPPPDGQAADASGADTGAQAGLKPNSVTGLVLDGAALDAVVAGANHELLRELAWRGIPVPGRPSPIRRAFPGPQSDATVFDLPPMDTWPDNEPLGSGWLARAGFFALFRSDVFRLFPDVIAYLCPAVWEDGKRELPRAGAQIRYPMAMGQLGPDLVYLGFEADENDLRGGAQGPGPAGMFLVLEVPSEGLSFGLGGKNGAQPRSLTTLADDGGWQTLTWDDLDGPALAPGSYPPAGNTTPRPVPMLDGLTWGKSSADMAAILLERPAVIALHGSDLLGAG